MRANVDAAPRSSVLRRTRALWRIRLARELPRYLLSALSVAGIAASVRFAVAPLRSAPARTPARELARPDRAAEGYAALFARRYLSWNAAEPQASARALGPFTGAGLEADGGLILPSRGEQRVEWVEVVQAREATGGGHVYTVAAQTDTVGMIYLTVGVTRTSAGSLALEGYPAFVGAPASTSAPAPPRLGEVSDPALATVVDRALRNYLDGSGSDLAADLVSGARVSLPGLALVLQSVQRLDWIGAGTVLAVVQAQDGRGAQYTLAYELDVTSQQGRWEISAVQMDPIA